MEEKNTVIKYRSSGNGYSQKRPKSDIEIRNPYNMLFRFYQTVIDSYLMLSCYWHEIKIKDNSI